MQRTSNPDMRAALSQEHARGFMLTDNSGGLNSIKVDALNLGAPIASSRKGNVRTMPLNRVLTI